MTIRMLVAYADQDKAHEEAVKFCIQVGGTYRHSNKTVTLGKMEWLFLGFPSREESNLIAGLTFQHAFISGKITVDVEMYLTSWVRSREKLLGLNPSVVIFDEETGDVL